MSDTDRPPPPPSSKRDPIAIVVGASLVAMMPPMKAPTDAAESFVTLVPVEPEQFAVPGEHYPRETHVSVRHGMQIGTIDELAAAFRANLIRAFDAFTLAGHPGVDIPFTGEPSLRRQTELFERHGLRSGKPSLLSPDNGRTLFYADKKLLRDRQAVREKSDGVAGRQPAEERDALMRLVAAYANHGGDRKEQVFPTDAPVPVQNLIDALTTLKADREAREAAQEAKRLAAAEVPA